MQTFLPSTSFEQSAKWLDRPARLGKQRLEGIDCLKLNLYLNYDISREVLNFPEWLIKRYGNHPTRLMWAGYEGSLFDYLYHIIGEWRNAGYKDCCMAELERLMSYLIDHRYDHAIISGKPPWLTEQFCSNHRSVMLGKCLEIVNKLEDEECRIHYFSSIKENTTIRRKLSKAQNVLDWYLNFNWPEQPAQRVLIDGKLRWPYLWSKSERIV